MARRSWGYLKATQADSPDRRRGYEKAGRNDAVGDRSARGRERFTEPPTLDKIAEAFEAELSVSLVDLNAS